MNPETKELAIFVIGLLLGQCAAIPILAIVLKLLDKHKTKGQTK